MQFTDEQNAAAVLAALEHNVALSRKISPDEVVDLVQVVLNAIPTTATVTAENLTLLSDSYTGLMEAAAGLRHKAIENGFEEDAAQHMAVGTYTAMMVAASGIQTS